MGEGGTAHMPPLFVHLTSWWWRHCSSSSRPAGEPRRQADQCHARYRRTVVASCSTVTQDLARFAPSRGSTTTGHGRPPVLRKSSARAGPCPCLRLVASATVRRARGRRDPARSGQCPRALLTADYILVPCREASGGGRAGIERRRGHHK